MTSCADLDMLFSLAGPIDFHHFFHSLVFLLAFLRYGEEIWPKEHWLLPPCPRYCTSYSFLCLVLTISFPSTKTLHSSICTSAFSLPSIPVKASHICNMGSQFFSQLLSPRQMCSSWHSAPVCCGTHSASAIYCSSCQAAVSFLSRIKKIKWSHTLFWKLGSPYEMQGGWLDEPHFALCLSNGIFQAACLDALEVQGVM